MSPFPIRSAAVDLGGGFSVEFTLDGDRFDCVWSPRMPLGRRGRQLLPAYRRARYSFLSDVAAKLGITITVADVGSNGEVPHG